MQTKHRSRLGAEVKRLGHVGQEAHERLEGEVQRSVVEWWWWWWWWRSVTHVPAHTTRFRLSGEVEGLGLAVHDDLGEKVERCVL